MYYALQSWITKGITKRAAAPARQQPTTDPASYEPVDIAIVCESTYPYLRGGLSAVVLDIIEANPDRSIGIIHITWDSSSPAENVYPVPDNVRWVMPVYQSMQEHRETFIESRPRDLAMSSAQRHDLAQRLVAALVGITEGDNDAWWELYDEGLNPRTRTFPLWALLGSKELMEAVTPLGVALEVPLSELFWLLREFFSLAYAVTALELPRADVFHSHTTGCAGLLAAAGARQHGSKFLLTEHNLYTRDTVNHLIDRSMALPLKGDHWRTLDMTPAQRAWSAWFTEVGRLTYAAADAITYLYPQAILDAEALGGVPEKSVVVPNGMRLDAFEPARQKRIARLRRDPLDSPDHVWNLAYLARVVPIKGLLDLLDAVASLRAKNVPPFHLDVMGPLEERPDYVEQCRRKIAELELDDVVTICGTVNVKERLHEIDLVVLPSYNEGQPMVVLEGMAVGVPVVGTDVGGMGQLVLESLGQRSPGACGVIVPPGNPVMFADAVEAVLCDVALYERLSVNARDRLVGWFQLHTAMQGYRDLYEKLGNVGNRRRTLVLPRQVRSAASENEDLDVFAGIRGEADGGR